MKAIVKKLPSVLCGIATVCAIALFLAFPARYTKCVWEGVSLWAISVLPATFPFLFLTALFRRQAIYPRLAKAVSPVAGKVFRVSGQGGCAAFLSAISGYPVGARTVLDLFERGEIGREESFRLACLCSTSGPMFLVGAVGVRMMKSAALGWIMLAAHFLSVWTVCFFLRFTAKEPPKKTLFVAAGKGTLYDDLYSSVLSVLCVGGAIAVFNAFGQMLADAGALAGINPHLSAVLRGLLEMTAGCASLAADPSPLSVATCCFFVTFGGACVLVQQCVFLTRAGVKTLPFLGVKLLQGLLSFGICYSFCLAAGVSV